MHKPDPSGVVYIDPPTGAVLLRETNLPSEILRTLVQVSQELRVNLLSGVNPPSDLKASEQVHVGRKYLAPVLEGYIEMTSPFRSSEIDRRDDYTRVKFRASLSLRVDPADSSVDGGANDGANTKDAKY